MSSNPFGDDQDAGFSNSSPWASSANPVTASTSPEGEGEDLIKNALEKDTLIKDITASQDGLKDLLSKIRAVEGETEKLASENHVLDLYIANLAKRP